MFRYPRLPSLARLRRDFRVSATLMGFWDPSQVCSCTRGFGRFRRLAPHAVGGLPPRSFSSRDRPSDIVSRTEAGAAPLIAFTHVCRQKDNGRSRKPTSASGYRPRVQSASRLHQPTWRDRSCLGFSGLSQVFGHGSSLGHCRCAHAISKPAWAASLRRSLSSAISYPLVGLIATADEMRHSKMAELSSLQSPALQRTEEADA